jgi:hypothetical protein
VSDAADVCEAIQHLIPSNIFASEAMDLLARRKRWAPLDEESEIVAFRIFVNSLWDAVQRGLLTTLTRTECKRLARNNMVWMGRAERHASSWEEVEAQGVSYEELAGRETTAMLESLAQEAAEAEVPTNGAGPSHAAPREEDPSQGAAAQAQMGEPRQPPVTSKGVQMESAAEEGTFLLEPLLQSAMAVAIHDLLEEEVPWLNMVSLADELLDYLYERLEEIREGVTSRPMRMVGPEQDEEVIRAAIPDGTPRQPPPPAGLGDAHPGGPPAAPGGPPAMPEGPPAGQQTPPAEGNPPAGPEGPPAQSIGPTNGPPATSAMYVGTPEEYLAGAADVAPLFEIWRSQEHGRSVAQGLSATRAKGH